MRGRERGAAWALLAGLVLRAVFVAVHPRFVGDTLIYGDLAQNMLRHHRYALTEGDRIRSTLIRLPGYPLFLAGCFLLFGVGRYLPVVWVQVGVDLLGCWLMGELAGRLFGQRVGRVCLWLACLCPFTANYAAAPLTETLSIFCVTAGLFGLLRWVETRGVRWAAAVGVAATGAVLLRPDGVLVGGVLLPAMGWVAWRGGDRRCTEQQVSRSGHDKGARERRARVGWWGVGLAFGLVGASLGLWTVRNWRLYHVVQPLAPKYANDPGEPTPAGFARWYRTWGTGLGDTARVYWEYDGSVLDLRDLPPWAIDSPAQRAETVRVYARYNDDSSSTPESEAAFAQLARERERAHPVRTFAVMPLLRLGDMWLRPRTELFGRHTPLDWWDMRARPRASLLAWGLGLLNVALLAAAGRGLGRWRRLRWEPYGVLAAAMLGYVVLRCLLLGMIDNSEPRYVLECYPIVLVLAGLGLAGLGLARSEA